FPRLGHQPLRDGNARAGRSLQAGNCCASSAPAALARRSRHKARSQKGEGLAQVGGDLTSWLALLELAGSDEHAQSDSRTRDGFDVAHLVANDRAVNRIKPKVRYSLQEHSGIWFAPGMIAAVLAKALHRVMRTVIDAADCRAFRLKTVAHPPRQGRISVLV